MTRRRGTGSLFQFEGNAVWWMKYYRGGKAVRESTGTRNRKEAENKLKTRLAELLAGTYTGPELERIRIKELADDLIREYRINGRRSLDDLQARWDLHLEPFFGEVKATQLSTGLLSRYVDLRQQEKAKNATINRELSALRRMMQLGSQSQPQKVQRIPRFPRLVENNVRKGFVDDAQFERLKSHCAELWFRTLLELGRTYGWRVDELLRLKVSNVDLKNRTIRLDVGSTKNKEGREVSMTGAVYALLCGCVAGKKPASYVITRPDGKQVKDFRGTWKAATKVAEVEGLLFHDLRRSAARDLRRAGVAEGVIMRIGGWKTRSVFERYAIVSQSDVKDALLKLEQSRAEIEKQAEQDASQNAQKALGATSKPN